MMTSRKARREFLKDTLRTLGGLSLSAPLSATVIEALAAPAFAQTPDAYRSKYIHFTMRGGPPRWCMDLPLRPKGNDLFVPGGNGTLNASFGTDLQRVGNFLQPVYSTYRDPVSGWHLPPVWGMSPAGVNFADLLSHTAFIRGIDTQFNSHGLGNAAQVAPVLGGPSVSGVVADKSRSPIAAVQNTSEAAFYFRSRSGTAPISVLPPHTNPIAKLLSAFRPTVPTPSFNGPAWNQAIDQALDHIDAWMKAGGRNPASVRRSVNDAFDLVENGSFRLQEQWPATVARYNTLLRSGLDSLSGQRLGIFAGNASIPGGKGLTGARQSAYVSGLNAGSAGFFHSSLTDLRDIISDATTVPEMAEGFALAEILFTKQLTSVMVFNMTWLSGLRFSDGGPTTGINGHDQHYFGCNLSTYTNTLWSRALFACTTELIGALKRASMFDDTVIHIASEFNRGPRSDGSGSDHGPAGSNSTLISGKIHKTQVLGNIKAQGLDIPTYASTWGVASPYHFPGGESRVIMPKDVAMTITSMLDASPVTANGYNLLAPENGNGWVAKVKEARNENS
jgi:hypothetical protein